MRKYLFAVLLALTACGGSDGSAVIASASRTAALQTGAIDAGPFVYELLTVAAPTTAGTAIDLSARVNVVLSDGFKAWIQFAEDGEAVDGFAQPIGSGDAAASLRHTPAKGGEHVYALRMVVQGVSAAHGSAQFINPSLTISAP